MKTAKNFYPIRSDDEIFARIRKEKEHVGYYTLPFADTEEIVAFANDIEQSTIVVIGIGGSSLGAKAIYDFLKPKERFRKRLLFWESTDPIDIKAKLREIDFENTLFIPISKSGSTIETIAIMKYLSSVVTLDYHNTVVISEEETPLSKWARTHQMRSFVIPHGGRFSVFSAVGLVPLALVGVDIDNMLKGAQEVHNSFFKHQRYSPRAYTGWLDWTS